MIVAAMSTDSEVERRASSADDDSGHESASDLSIRTRFTNFFIDNILRPDFGRSNYEEEEGDGEDSAGRREDTIEITQNKPGGKLRTGDVVKENGLKQEQWPAWVYCTRYSDRPSSGPRTRKMKARAPIASCTESAASRRDEKRPRTAFSAQQLQRLKHEFQQSNYLTEERRRGLAAELRLNESQIKIWFQNKRAKIKKANGMRNSLAMQLMKQGLYNHSTVAIVDIDGGAEDKPKSVGENPANRLSS